MQGVRSVSRVTLDANIEGRCRLLETQYGGYYVRLEVVDDMVLGKEEEEDAY